MKQRKVLICDDEMMMREGLKVFIDWNVYGIDTILTAPNGIKAIEIFKTYKPDIVITDIRMPGMNGIQLIETIHSISPDSICIIISGYDDFEIARQGFSIGAFDYLMKPIQAELLCSVITRSISVLDEKERKAKELDEVEDLLYKTRPVLIQNLVMKIVRGSYADSNAKLIEDFSKLGVSFNYEYYRSIVGSVLLPLGIKIEKENLYEIIRQTLRELFPFRSSLIEANSLTVYDNNSFTLLVGFNSKEHWELLESKIRKAFSDMESNFAMYYVLFFGQVTKSLNDINFSFMQTRKFCDFLLFIKKFGTYHLEDFPVTASLTFLIPPEMIRQLLKSIEKKEKLDERLIQIKKYILQFPVKDKDILFTALIDLMMAGAKLLIEHGKSIQNIYTYEHFSNDFLNNFENIDCLFDWLRQYFNTLTDFLHDSDVLQADDTAIEVVKEYVKTNYSLPLTLKIVAELTYYNPNYFGRLFFKCENQRFYNYLHQVRIEAAKELLLSTPYSYPEISEMIGYNDISYFFKVFKKVTGETPGNFKKLHDGKINV